MTIFSLYITILRLSYQNSFRSPLVSSAAAPVGAEVALAAAGHRQTDETKIFSTVRQGKACRFSETFNPRSTSGPVLLPARALVRDALARTWSNLRLTPMTMRRHLSQDEACHSFAPQFLATARTAGLGPVSRHFLGGRPPVLGSALPPVFGSGRPFGIGSGGPPVFGLVARAVGLLPLCMR